MSLKDIDAFIQHFVQKCVQVIVQSRLGTERTQTKCKPDGKDWFNLDIHDIKDIVDQTAKCLKLISSQSSTQSLFFVKKNWKICCEISLRNSDGISLVLEYWIFSNTTLSITQELPETKLSQLVYQILNRMSYFIKSLIVLTRSTPAYKLSSKGQSADSYVICYRIYPCDDNFLSSIMDSVNPTNQFSPLKHLGTIRSFYNELSISLIYRTSMNMNSDSKISAMSKNEKYICDKNDLLLSVKDDHFKPESNENVLDVKEIFKPLNPAFAGATKHKETLAALSNTPFSALLLQKENSPDFLKEKTLPPKNTKSTPITIPIKASPKSTSKSPQIYSTSNESFVFVELNAPFASDDREFDSFFHGPCPTFITNNDDDVSNDIDELSLQLAELESNASQFDSFVESIITEDKEETTFEV